MPWIEINGVQTFVAADATTTAAGGTPGPGGNKSWFARHKVLTAIGATVAVFGVIGAVVPSDTTPSTTPSSQAQAQTQPVAPVPTETEEAPAEETDTAVEPDPEPEPAKPSMTAGQSNAVRKAESYLKFAPFSRSGLIDQLKFDGFSTADSAYGVDQVDANWNTQAKKKAQSYLDMTAFSRSGLIDQLKFDGFTTAQARHGVTAAGL